MRRGYIALVMTLVAGVLAVVWWASWSSPPDVITQARRAFGTEPIVHALASLGIDPRGPAMRPITSGESIEVWYDASRRRTHVVLRRATKVTLDSVEDILPPHVPPVGAAAPLYEFITGYRSALAGAKYRVESSGRIQGRRVLWLSSPTLDVDVAVDPVSYQPIWLRSTYSTMLTELVVAETKPYDPADFLTLKQRKARHL